MALLNTSLTSTVSNVYASSGNSVVSVIYFCNTDGTAVDLNLWAVQAGGTAGATNQVYKNVQIAGSDTFVVDMEKIVLADQETLQANASGNVTATVSYVGI